MNLGMLLDALEDDTGGEGFRGRIYRDTVGVWTIGYGHNCVSGRALTRPEGRMILTHDVLAAEEEVKIKFASFGGQPEIVQRTLVELCFNMGWPRLSTFKRMLAALERADYATAAMELRLSKWYGQVQPARAARLVNQLSSGAPR